LKQVIAKIHNEISPFKEKVQRYFNSNLEGKCIRIQRCNTHLVVMYIFYLQQVMYGYYHENCINMMEFCPCFIKIKIRLLLDHHMQK
jgi:hypothetical protein